MRKRKITRSLAGVLAVLLAVGSVCTLPVSAGRSETVIDKSTIQDQITESIWNNPTGEVKGKNGVIVFSKDAGESARLITKTAARISETENLAGVRADLEFEKLPKGKQFIVAFGLPNVEAKPGDKGNVEIAFADKGGLKVSITEYTKDGKTVSILKETSCGAVGKASLNAVISTNGKLKVEVAGKQLVNAKLTGTGEGRIGFLQTGSCGVKISNVQISTYKYDAPENCDISEDFEKGDFNKNELTSRLVYQSHAYYPTKASIEEYNGSNVFMFHNSEAAYIGTMYQYSNFEITFDVPYFARENELDEERNVVRPKTEAFGVAFGGEAADYNDWGYTSSSDMILFRNTSQIMSMNHEDVVIQDPQYLFADPKQGKPFSVKVSMIDSVITVSIKWMSETKFKKVLTYQINRETPTGYVQIWTTGLTNFAIDNLKIVNKDKEPNTLKVPYESTKIEKPADYDYQPIELVYEEKEPEQDTFSYYLLIPIVAGACAVVFVILAGIKSARKKKRKAGGKDEAV